MHRGVQNIVVDQSCEYVAPYRCNILSRLQGRPLIPRGLSERYSIIASEVHVADKIRNREPLLVSGREWPRREEKADAFADRQILIAHGSTPLNSVAKI